MSASRSRAVAVFAESLRHDVPFGGALFRQIPVERHEVGSPRGPQVRLPLHAPSETEGVELTARQEPGRRRFHR